jgi:hypothetical protein
MFEISLSDTRRQFRQPPTSSVYPRGAQKRKKDSQVVSLLRFRDLRAQKLSVNMLVKLTRGSRDLQHTLDYQKFPPKPLFKSVCH